MSYELTGKMIGEIKDPAGFADCCKTSPDQCTSRYIGEFIEGRGAIYHQAEKKAAAQAGATDLSSGAGGDVAFSHGTAWERGVEFPNPVVFFAFKISETPYQPSFTVRLQQIRGHAPAVLTTTVCTSSAAPLRPPRTKLRRVGER